MYKLQSNYLVSQNGSTQKKWIHDIKHNVSTMKAVFYLKNI